MSEDGSVDALAPTDSGFRLTVPDLLRRAAGQFGSADYLVTLTGRLTYAEAEARSAQVARWLLREGVGKGTRVGLFLPSGTEWAVWWLAVSRIGAVAVPLSTLYTPVEVAKVVRLADVHLLVAPPTVLTRDVAALLEAAFPELSAVPAAAVPTPAVPTPAVPAAGSAAGTAAGSATGPLELANAPYLRRIVLTGPSDRGWATRWNADSAPGVRADLLAVVEAEVTPADLAIMVHTSGSTADPKGVLHTHGTLVRQTSTWPAAIRGLTGVEQGPRILCAMPFFWIGGILAATGALHEPVAVLVLERLEAGAALDLAERERAGGVVGWPAFTQQLRLHPSFPNRDLSAAPALRAGPVDLAMAGVPGGHPIHRSLTESGGSFAFTDTAIVDTQGRPVADGAVGELLIRGPGSMAGYNKQERADVFDADGWYHTSDQVYRLSGDPRLFYVGRESELIKAAGANVSPREVEAVIEEFPEVAHCVVTGVAHPTRGEEICVVIVTATATATAGTGGEAGAGIGTGSEAGPGVDLAALTARTRAQLSSYKVPTRWIVATDDEVPSLPSGKPDRRGLRALVEQGHLK